MPPDTPSTTRGMAGVSSLSSSRSGSSSLSGSELGRVDVLAGQQVLADLAQRDRERLLLDVGLHQRADVLEQAFAELRVVGVDLPGALGTVENQLVLAVGLGQQVVDRGVGDTLGGDVRGRHVLEPHSSWVESTIK